MSLLSSRRKGTPNRLNTTNAGAKRTNCRALMKDADLDAGLKLRVGYFVQWSAQRAQEWSAVESGMQRRNMDASTLLILKRAGRRTKGAEVCSLHNYSKLQCFLPIGEEEVRSRPSAL